MKRAAVVGCNLNFAPGAEAVLRGLRRFHPDVERYCFVPPAELAEAGRRFAGLATALAPPRPLAGVPAAGHLQAHLARFFLNTIPADAVAWFDCDVVVCRPVDAVWEVGPGRVRAVPDHCRDITYVLGDFRQPFVEAFPEAPGRHGFNAGLFALRPADWPDLPERFEAGLAACRFPTFTGLVDQPLLNLFFAGRIDPLGIEYNAHYIYDHPIPRGVRVVHYTGGVKPWQPGYPRHEPAYYYWLRYGLGEERPGPLLRARLRILARTPRRVLGRVLKARGLR